MIIAVQRELLNVVIATEKEQIVMVTPAVAVVVVVLMVVPIVMAEVLSKLKSMMNMLQWDGNLIQIILTCVKLLKGVI